ncbi:hypothetical protein [Microbacterium sp.]|uniref:hypothetical protein n=1 Tax=Microbacterium sp. TaxID=51671 RepID=UPI003F95C169
MKRSTVWIVVAAVAAVAVVGGAVLLLWPRDAAPADGGQSTPAPESEAPEVADADELAQQQLDELLEQCTQPAAEPPPSCGIRIPWAADFAAVDSIQYRIEQAPVLTFAPPTFRADDGILVATVAGTAVDGAEKTMTYRTENWMLRGDADVTDDSVVLEPW